jgi:hypothetical protein
MKTTLNEKRIENRITCESDDDISYNLNEETGRGQWSNKASFILACIGYAVGKLTYFFKNTF